MNYLAHSLLSPNNPLILLGNFSGDFVKGSINPGLDDTVWSGVHLHRTIDSYTDSHAIVIQSKKRISSERRRFAGIIIDVAYDYFLSKNWDTFCEVPRTQFIDNVYMTLEEQADKLPPTFLEVKERVIHYDWLNGYNHLSGIDQTIESIGRRFQKRTGRPNIITGSISEIREHVTELEEDFLEFFPQLQQRVSEWITMNVIQK